MCATHDIRLSHSQLAFSSALSLSPFSSCLLFQLCTDKASTLPTAICIKRALSLPLSLSALLVRNQIKQKRRDTATASCPASCHRRLPPHIIAPPNTSPPSSCTPSVALVIVVDFCYLSYNYANVLSPSKLAPKCATTFLLCIF